MESLLSNMPDLRSDPSGDVIMEIIAGATKFKIMMQCIEAGLFDNLETHKDPVTADAFSKMYGYNPVITEKLLNTLTCHRLLKQETNDSGKFVYKNMPGTSKYLTRSRKSTMIDLATVTQNSICQLCENIGNALKPGTQDMDINKNYDNNEPDNGKLKQKLMNEQNKKMNSQKVPNKFANKADSPAILPQMMPPMDPNIQPDLPPNMSKMMGMPIEGSKMPPGNSMAEKMAMMAKMGAMDKKKMMGMMYAKMMTSYDGFSATCAPTLVKAFDLSSHSKAVDLGGGSGRISLELTKQYPNIEATVFDLPPVTQLAQKLMPVTDRLTFVSGDFMEDDIPSGDLYILSHVLHCFNSEGVDKLLSKVFTKLPPGGTLLVFEKMLNANKSGPPSAVTNDLLLTVMKKGMERTPAEYQKLFAKHGFSNFQYRKLEGRNYFDVLLVKKPFKTHC